LLQREFINLGCNQKQGNYMKTIIAYAALAATVFLGGCATTKNWSATGGSRADGVVRLSYDYGMFEKPQLSEDQALSLARQRCSSWGYTGAEAFGGSTQQCSSPSGGGCQAWTVTKEYQCTGSTNPNTN